jgi:hypothetical protein
MASNIYKVIANGTANLTDQMSGTSVSFPFEVVEAFVDGVSTAFTYVDGVLDIPTYTTGTVKAEFTIYITYGEVSNHAPKDPENPASDIVFWNERIDKMPTISSSIENFETGRVAFKTSNIAILCLGGDFEVLLDQVDFVGTEIKCYLNDSLVFSAITNGSQVSQGKLTIIVKNQATVLDEECSWGDPSYLNRIEADHNSSLYNGALIPEKYHGAAIPFVIGDRMAYDDFEGQAVDAGQDITAVPPLVQIGSSITSEAVGTGFICKVIPVNATTGIICRIPSFQSFNQTTSYDTAISLSAAIWSKIVDGSSGSIPILPGQLTLLETTGAPVPGRCLRIGPTTYHINGNNNTGINWQQAKYDSDLHLCATQNPGSSYDPAAISVSYTTTPGGHRLVKITATDVDFTKNDHFLVCSNLSGSVSAPKALQFIVESHGLSVDTPSFDDMDAIYPQKTCIQAGAGKSIQTVNEIISQINRSLLTYSKIPLNGNAISMGDIDLSPAITDTLTDEEIRELRVRVTGDEVFSRLEFEPIYAKGNIYRDDVYDYKTNIESSSIYKSDKTKTVAHVLTSKPSTRWQDMADYYGFPSPSVSFMLLTDTLYEVGDYVRIDHSDFTGDIIITSVSPKQIGSAITGKKI